MITTVARRIAMDHDNVDSNGNGHYNNVDTDNIIWP